MLAEPKVMSSHANTTLWQVLAEDLLEAEDITNSKPLLAHYTSIQTIELMLRNDEIWLSNPLNMNDHQEVVGGLGFAMQALTESEKLRSAFDKPDEYRD